MKNYYKMTLVALSLLFLVSFLHPVSSYNYNTYTYTDRSDTITFDVDENGFALTHKYSEPRINPQRGWDYYDWTYDLRKGKRTAYYNGYDNYYGRTDLDYPRQAYDGDKALQSAFKAYESNLKYQYQLESQRLSLANRRYYGYGYSGAVYRYGW